MPVAGAASTLVKPSSRAAFMSSGFNSSCCATSISARIKRLRAASDRAANSFDSVCIFAPGIAPRAQGIKAGVGARKAAGKPTVLDKSTNPAYTVCPSLFHMRAPAGIATSAPTATMTPSRITSVPFSITLPGANTSRAPVMACQRGVLSRRPSTRSALTCAFALMVCSRLQMIRMLLPKILGRLKMLCFA